jgi:uncharacterized protein YbaP (TraB family)
MCNKQSMVQCDPGHRDGNGWLRIFTATMTALFLSLFLVASAVADGSGTSVYRVTSSDGELFLGGTVHLLRQSDYPLPPQYNQAYDAADVLYFETDISALSDMSMQATLMQALTYQDGRTLRTVLNDEAYSALEAHMAEVGLPLAMMQNFKPGLLVSTLSVLEFQKMGFTPQGIDMYFHTRAIGDGKPTGELESVQDQIDLLAGMGEGYESEFILYSLADFDRAAETIEDMIRTWRSGDLDEMQALFVDEMQAQAPDVYDAMLVDRNNNWMPVIESLFGQEDTALVLVGAAHLVGEDGLIALLERRGYTVQPL